MKPEMQLRIDEATKAGKHVVITRANRWLGEFDTQSAAIDAAMADERASKHRIFSPRPVGKPKLTTLTKSDPDKCMGCDGSGTDPDGFQCNVCR